MKKILVLVFLLIASVSFASSITYIGADGQPVDVSTSNPLPTSGNATVSISTITAELATGSNTIGAVNAAAYSTVLSTNTSATAASAQVASLADRLVVRITNQSATETVWIAENSAVATVSSGLPLLPYQIYEEILGPDVPVAYISATSCKINIFQAK